MKTISTDGPTGGTKQGDAVFEDWFHNLTNCWMCDHREVEQARAIAKAAYELGMKSPESLPSRVCKTLEGIMLLEMDDDNPFHSDVYTFCHIAQSGCKNPHLDWVKKFEETEAEIHAACASPNEKKRKFYDSIEVGNTYWIWYTDHNYPCQCPCHTHSDIQHCVPCCYDESYTGPARCVEKLDDKQQCVFENPKTPLHRYVLDPTSIRTLTDEEKNGLREQLQCE